MVRCIRCGESSDDVTIAADVDDGLIRCLSCDATYDADEVRAVIAGWADTLAWIDQHPARQAVRRGRSLADAADPEVLR